jgi:ComF family protein
MIKQTLRHATEPILSFLFPRLCVSCQQDFCYKEEVLCLSCDHKMPKTDFHLRKENPFANRLRGRFPFYNAASYFLFQKGGHVQELIHAIKYDDRPTAAMIIGEQYGQRLRQSPFFSDVEAIVPVPMHPVKQRIRGYNQAAMFAMGLANVMEIPMLERALSKQRLTTSQTKRRGRFSRWENVVEVFALEENHLNKLAGKHILLVDDVLTTGATLEACAEQLLKVEGIKLSIATMAMVES